MTTRPLTTLSEHDLDASLKTNALENLNREFRRRTKTQASFSTEAAAVTLLFGLVAFGQIVLRKMDGYEKAASILGEGVVSGRVTR